MQKRAIAAHGHGHVGLEVITVNELAARRNGNLPLTDEIMIERFINEHLDTAFLQKTEQFLHQGRFLGLISIAEKGKTKRGHHLFTYFSPQKYAFISNFIYFCTRKYHNDLFYDQTQRKY